MSLREYNSYKTSNKTAVAIGDVVLIHDNVPRNQWKIRIVTDLHKGKDGLVRSVSLRISSGNELLRPIEKLYPLEVSSENNAQGIEKEDKEAIADTKTSYSTTCCSEGNSWNPGTIKNEYLT